MQTIKCPHCGNDFVTTYKTCPFCGTPAPAQPVNRKGGKRLAGKQPKAARSAVQAPDAVPAAPAPDTIPEPSAPAPDRISAEQNSRHIQAEQIERPRPPEQAAHAIPSEQDAVPPQPDEINIPPDVEQAESLPRQRSFWRYFFFVLSLLLIAAAVFIVINIITTLFGQKGSPAAPAPSAELSDTAIGISFAQSDVHLEEVGHTAQLSVASNPATMELDPISWESSDPDVVTVDETGLASAVSEGTAVITAQSGPYSASCNITVGAAFAPETSPAASGASSALTLNRQDFTLAAPGTSFQLTASGTEAEVTWSAKDPSVATVSENGMVVAVGKGTTTITAEADGQTATCIVRVR